MKPITIVEIMVTYMSLGWAAVMFMNPDTFGLSMNFRKIAQIVQHEWIMGVICIIVAGIKIVGMLLKNMKIRRVGLFTSAIFWTLISATFLVSEGGVMINTGFVAYSGIAVMCLWASKEVTHGERTEQR